MVLAIKYARAGSHDTQVSAVVIEIADEGA